MQEQSEKYLKLSILLDARVQSLESKIASLSYKLSILTPIMRKRQADKYD